MAGNAFAFRMPARSVPTGLPEPGSPEHGLLFLLLLEAAGLILLRRYFRSAHGG